MALSYSLPHSRSSLTPYTPPSLSAAAAEWPHIRFHRKPCLSWPGGLRSGGNAGERVQVISLHAQGQAQAEGGDKKKHSRASLRARKLDEDEKIAESAENVSRNGVESNNSPSPVGLRVVHKGDGNDLARKSWSSSTSSEVSLRGAGNGSGRAVIPSLKADKIVDEHSEETQEKSRRRRPKKGKKLAETEDVSNVPSASDTPKHAARTTAKKKKKKPVIGQNQELLKSESGNVEIVAGKDAMESDGGGIGEKEVESDLDAGNGQRATKNTKRAARRKKTVRHVAESRDLGRTSLEVESQSGQGDPKAVGSKKSVGTSSSINNDSLASTKSEVQSNEERHKKLQRESVRGTSSSGTEDSRNANKNRGRPPNGKTDEGSGKESSSDHAANAARVRTKRSPKKMSASPQTESEVENASSGPSDVFDTIIWCRVYLTVQGELEHNESLYVVGANPELGMWDLSLAVPLAKSDEHGHWEHMLKIPRGTMLEYKYFTEIQGADPDVVDRRFGPEMHYYLPWKEGHGAELEVIRDIWLPDVPRRLPLLTWGNGWWEEMDSVVEKQGERDEDGLEWSKGEVNEENKKLQVEPLEPSAKELAKDSEFSGKGQGLKKKVGMKVLSREVLSSAESVVVEQRNGSIRRGTEDGDAKMEGTEAGSERPAVEILINSPQCTMQRMAILESGKLVELLLEPVNTRVQVGNVYLGVVRQLLPGMTGAFVDIGGFQLALMDITRNQYPYTFPSISHSSGGRVLDSLEAEEDSEWEGEGKEEDDDEDEHEHGGGVAEEEEVDNEEVDEDDRFSQSKVAGELDKGIHAEGNGRTDPTVAGPLTVNFGRKLNKWRKLQEGMQVIVQVKKEALGKKGPRLTAFPSLAGRFWVLIPGGKAVGVSRRITGPERKRLRNLAESMQPPNFALTARSEALECDHEELEKDLARLMETWTEVLERASVAAGLEGTVPVLLHRAMGQTLTIVRDFFTDKVQRMVIDSHQCYQEVTSYLQEVAPHLSPRVELYTDQMPIFDAFGVEAEIDKFSSRRVSLPNGGYLVMEETEALVSIDVNGGTGVFSRDMSQEEAILGVNLAAARQIAIEMRLRDMGGIIVVDFIDMESPNSARLVVEEMRLAIAPDRSSPTISEISEFGLMEMTRKRVRPSVTLTISDPCLCCGGVGRIEAHETTLSKIERALRRLLAAKPGKVNSLDSAKWPQFLLRVDPVMGEYLKGRKRKRITQLSVALKVWLNLKVALEFNMGQFQVLDQHKAGSEKRSNGSTQPKSNQQNGSPSLLKKRVWPGKRRRNFTNQYSNKES